MRVEGQQNEDETGEHEEFNWDLFPLVDASKPSHLDESGLPRVGSHIRAGIIIICKIAKTRAYDPDLKPTAIEIQGIDRQTRCKKYGGLW